MSKPHQPTSQPSAGGGQNPKAVSPTALPSKNDVLTFDPRTLGTPVYEKLSKLKSETRDPAKLKKQKSMAQELYTYLSTWGLMRLKAEEIILKDGREDPVKTFFECLQEIVGNSNLDLESLKRMPTEEYLGLTGLGLEIAREFSFWVSAIYHDVKGEE
ncbi:MAG: hypothetical protein Q6J46_00025 [Thermostichus sp. DG02_2_bins_29]